MERKHKIIALLALLRAIAENDCNLTENDIRDAQIEFKGDGEGIEIEVEHSIFQLHADAALSHKESDWTAVTLVVTVYHRQMGSLAHFVHNTRVSDVEVSEEAVRWPENRSQQNPQG